MKDHANAAKSQGARERLVAALIGALFVGIAVAIVVTTRHDWSFGTVLAAIVVGGLGVEALFSAARSRRCLLSRIGPLP
ncbi:MAG: hypothetical protein ACM3O5_03160 [Betaproteobacteria bacterium]